MPWTLRGTATVAYATAADCVVTAPAGIAANDVLFAIQYQEHDTGVAVTLPTGWALLQTGENANSNPDTQYRAWYKLATDSEPSTYTFTHASVYRAMAFAAWTPPSAGTTALDVAAAAVSTGTTSSLALAAITTTVADTLIVAAANNWHGRDTTPASGYSQAVEVVEVDGGTHISWKEQASAGSTGTVTLTYPVSVDSAGALNAFKPPAAASAPFPPFPPILRPVIQL